MRGRCWSPYGCSSRALPVPVSWRRSSHYGGRGVHAGPGVSRRGKCGLLATRRLGRPFSPKAAWRQKAEKVRCRGERSRRAPALRFATGRMRYGTRRRKGRAAVLAPPTALTRRTTGRACHPEGEGAPNCGGSRVRLPGPCVGVVDQSCGPASPASMGPAARALRSWPGRRGRAARRAGRRCPGARSPRQTPSAARPRGWHPRRSGR